MSNEKGFSPIYLVITLVVIIIGFLVYTLQSKSAPVTEEAMQSPVTPSSDTIFQPVAEPVQEKYEIIKGTDGWDTYKLNTRDQSLLYMINLPSEWEYKNGVFQNKDKKIAEIFGDIRKLEQDQSCSGFFIDDPRIEVISNTPIQIAGYKGIKQVSRVQYEGGGLNDKDTGFWYPSTYCLQTDSKAFMMTFYELELGKGNTKLNEQILATLQFK